jgi:SHS2 domain-containing protein
VTGDECPVTGVRALEHTADVGLEVEAPALDELFRRGALGAMWMVLGRMPGEAGAGSPGAGKEAGKEAGEADAEEAGEEAGEAGSAPASGTRDVELREEDLASLFRSWLREILFWQETEGFVTRDVRFKFLPAPSCHAEDGQAFCLEAKVEGNVEEGPVEREIKGVTYHGLEVQEKEDGWRARVIFDV